MDVGGFDILFAIVSGLISLAFPLLFVLGIARALTAMSRPGGPLDPARRPIASQRQSEQDELKSDGLDATGFDLLSDDAEGADELSLDDTDLARLNALRATRGLPPLASLSATTTAAAPRLPSPPASALTGRPETPGASLASGDGFLARYQAANATKREEARLRRLLPLGIVLALLAVAYLLLHTAAA